MATTLPPPVPQPQQVEEVNFTRMSRGASSGFVRIMNDFRLLFIAFLLCLMAAWIYGVLFMISADRGSSALLYVLPILGTCWVLQRLARPRRSR